MALLSLRTSFVGLITAGLIFSSFAAYSDTYTVTNTDDSGLASLREAVSNANGNAGVDTIVFDDALDNQTITISSQIDITDAAAGLIIDASALANGITLNGDNTSRIFGASQNQALTLKNLTLTAGKAEGSGSDCTGNNLGNRGGALCTKGELILFNTTISNSIAKGFGGGFYAAGNATLNNSTISENHTTEYGADGGGFYAGGAEIRLNNSLISGNYTVGASADGGGFFAGIDNGVGTGATWINNSIISGNSTQEATGITSDGGGFQARGPTNISNSTISGNHTESGSGGGFYNHGSVTMNNSTVSGNSVANGSQIKAAGITVLGSVTLNNSTITQNKADNGSHNGVHIRAGGPFTVTLNSTILSDNGDNNFAVFLYSNSIPTIAADHSLLGDSAAELLGGTNTNNIFDNTPKLAPLADNGCMTMAGAPGSEACVQTHALLATSPALNKGVANGFTEDQRMMPRIINGYADIGAHENPHQLGDCNRSGEIDVLDVICTVNQVLAPNLSSLGECNGIPGVNVQDVICVINKVLEN